MNTQYFYFDADKFNVNSEKPSPPPQPSPIVPREPDPTVREEIPIEEEMDEEEENLQPSKLLISLRTATNIEQSIHNRSPINEEE